MVLDAATADGSLILLPFLDNLLCGIHGQVRIYTWGFQLRGEWLSGSYSLRQVTEVKVGRVRSNSGWVTSEALPHHSPYRPSEGTLN